MQTISTGQMTADEYHADRRGVGSSFLKEFMRSPLHAWAKYLDPEREPTDKAAFRIGRAWHCAVFEPEAFEARYVAGHGVHAATTRAKVLAELLALDADDAAFELARCSGVPDDLKATTKEGKKLYEDLAASGKRPIPESDLDWIVVELNRMHGKDVLAAKDIERVLKMAGVARAHPVSRVVFDQMAAHGAAEQSMFATDPISGVGLKIRPDYMLAPCAAFPHGLIIDGKSAADADVEGFGRAVWNYSYGLQASLYRRVYRLAMRTEQEPAFLWLAQEKEAPHAAAYYGAGEDLCAHWAPKIDALLKRVSQCQETGVWPGYPTTVATLALPAWAEKRMQEGAA